jgi:hypothetical protein
MTTCSAPTHPDHAHQHGPGCGHPAILTAATSITCMMVIYITPTKVMSTST